MTTKNKKIISFTFVGIFIVVLTLGIGLHMNIVKLPYTVVGMNAQYDANYGDDRVLVGGSNNVFVGKVIKQSGVASRVSAPETQFLVEVIDNIKGKLQGTVIVSQFGGYKNGVLYIMSGETGDSLHSGDNANYFLQPGLTYLLSTRGPSPENFYVLNSYPTAYKVISTDKTLSSEQLLELSKNDIRVKALLLAYPNEILLEADIARLGTPNSFVSLSGEEQEKIKAEVEQIKAQNGIMSN
jgi:hypothetical protein